MKRPEALISRKPAKEKEFRYINELLESNGYPAPFVRQAARPNTTRGSTPGNTRIVLPYVKNVSERIARVLTPYNIQVTHKPTQKLASFFGLPKDPISPLDNCSVVYEIACADCNKVYVGRTKNSLRTRVKQHEAALRLLQCEKSAVAEHAYANQHRIAWKDSKVL